MVLSAALAETLAARERWFIRQLKPVFNIRSAAVDDVPRAVTRLLGAAASSDVREAAAALLRKNRPVLRPEVWAAMVAAVRCKWELELAAKLGRQARQVCPKLNKLRAVPSLVFPCHIPKEILQQLQRKVRATLLALPFVIRAFQFDLMVEGSPVCWEKTPYAESVLSPAVPSWDKVGPCQCSQLPPSMPRYQGHVLTRTWEAVPCCATLKKVAGFHSLQCRTYPGLDAICERFANRTKKFMQMGGFSEEDASRVQRSIIRTTGISSALGCRRCSS